MSKKCCQNMDKIRSTIRQSYAGSSVIKIPLNRSRRKLWEFEHNYHCAIIGTCLSISEVRNLLKRFQIKVSEFSDYDIHTIAVTMIENNDSRTKKINNHLDRKFKTAILKVKKMDRQELRQEWCQALKSGEVIATFWAIMTHPAADAAMQKDIYGDIHMLSHMSGASNRADLKHLHGYPVASPIAADGEQGPYSLARQFVVKAIPAQPTTLISGDDNQLNLSWQAGASEQSYETQLAEDPDFTRLLSHDILKKPELIIPQEYLLVRYFRVRLLEPDGYSGAWSTIQKIDPLPDNDWLYLFLPTALLILLL